MRGMRTFIGGAAAALLLSTPAFATVYYADPGALNDGNLYVDIPTNMGNIRGVYIVGKRGDMDTMFWAPRTNDWQPFLNSFGFVMGYRTQGEAMCPEERDVPQKTLAALPIIAAQSGHPELAYAPVFLFGFSADAAGPAAMAEVYPNRTLGGVWHSTASSCNYGTPESQTNDLYYTPTMEISCATDGWGWQLIHMWTTMSNYVDRVITGSVAWTHIQHGGGHGSAMNRTTIQFPWILSVVGQRLPTDTTPYTNLPTLSRLNTNYLWRGDQGPRGLYLIGSFWSNFDSNGQSRTVGSFQIWPATNANPSGLSSCPTHSALPDEAFARVWQVYNDTTNAAVTPSGNSAALNIQTVAILPMETVVTEEGGKKLRFAMVRSRKSPAPLNVPFTLSGTASNGVDYAWVTNFTCTIPANEWAGYLELSPLDDTLAEGSETVTVTLTPNTNLYYTHSPNFLTATINDDETAAPVITALSPVNYANNFIGTNLVATFSRKMAKGTGFIAISNLTDGVLADSVDVTDSRVTVSENSVTIGLTNYLAGPKLYAVTMAGGVLKDTQDHPFAGIATNTTWRFTALTYETNAPVLLSVWPANGATDFNRFETLRLTFDEPVQALGGYITISNLTLSRNVERISATDASRVTISGSNVFVQPLNPLAASNEFCVRIEPGVIADLFPPAPNPFGGLTNTTAWRFFTKRDPGAFVETFDTENAVSDPTFTTNLYGAFGGVSNVQYSWYKIYSATGSACALIDGNGVVIESPNGGASYLMTEFLPNVSAFSYQLRQAVTNHTPGFYNRTRVMAITRNGVTNQLKQYDYVTSPNVSTVTNMNLMPMNEPVKLQIIKTLDNLELTLDNLAWTPYQSADTNAPVPTFVPGTASIALPTTQVFAVQFNEDIVSADGSPMDNALAQEACSLTNVLTGAAVPFTAEFGYEFGLPQILITPAAPLDAFTSYQVALKPNAVRDLNGNTNTAGARALLTTAPDTRYFRETFENNNASTNSNPNLWGGGTYVGDEGALWSYNSAGSAGYASGAYRLDGAGLVLRGSSSNAMITAVNVPGGVGSFMVVFRNGDGTSGSRKLALDVAGQHYESVSADSADATLFRVDNIHAAGNENTYNTIVISNATSKAVTMDSIVWTAYRDPLQVIASTTSLQIVEGGSGSVEFTLNRTPDNDAVVNVQRVSGSTNITAATDSFVLNEVNWNSGVSVQFSTAEDPDVLNDSAMFVFSGPDVLSATVAVTQLDNDVGPEVSTTNLIVREGRTNSFQVRMTKMPPATATVTVSRVSGDTDLSVAGADTFLFTPANWSTWQTVYIAAAPDADTTDGTAIFSIASGDVDPVLLTATERDAAWTNWVAFHDMHPTNDGDAATTTLGFEHGTAYGLTNALTGQGVAGVTLTIRYFDKNGAEKSSSATLDNSAVANPANGTHAALLFTNNVRPAAVYKMALTTDYATVTIGGLSPDRSYGIGLFVNRGNFTPRTRFTLQNATNFYGAGTSGIGDCGDSDPATYEVEVNNGTRGYVAMWTNITPTGNGGTSFTVKQDHFPLTTGTTFRIAQAIWITGEMPPTDTNPPPPAVTNTLTVVSAYGTPAPSGTTAYTNGSVLNVSIGGSPAAQGATQLVATGWTMAGNSPTSGSATNFSLTLTNNATLTWLWQTNVLLQAAAGANGSISSTGGWYSLGASVTVTASANSGYSFAGWSGDVTGSTNANPLTMTMDRARAVTANFLENPPPPAITNSLTVVSAYGTPAPSDTTLYTNGTVLGVSIGGSPVVQGATQLVATGWTMAGNSPVSGSATNFSLTLTNNATLTWLWQTNVLLQAAAGANGSISSTGGWYSLGASVTVTASANSGYSFAGWSGDVTGSTNANPLTLTMDRARAVTANFQSNSAPAASLAWRVDFNGSGADTLALSNFTGWTVAAASRTQSFANVDGGSVSSSITVRLLGTGTFSAYERAMNLGAVTNLYRDGAQTTVSPITLAISNLAAGAEYALRIWYFDDDFSSGYTQTYVNVTDGGSVTLGALTNTPNASAATGHATLPTGLYDTRYCLSASLTAGTGGEIRVSITPNSGNPKINAFELTTAGASGEAPGPVTNTLTVVSAYGTPAPSGTTAYTNGSVLNVSIGGSPAAQGATQLVATGWTMAGNSPVSGSATNFSLTLTNNATLTWLWQTNVLLQAAAGANGSVSSTGGWYSLGASVTVTASANSGYSFAGWSGDVTGDTNANPLTLTMDRARAVTAYFATNAPTAVTNTLTVTSTHGMASPTGVNLYTNGSSVTCAITNSPIVSGATQFVCVGWIGTGSVPASGSNTSVTFTLTSDSSLTWLWQTNYLLQAYAGANGSVGTTGGWYRSTSNATVSATPDSGYLFAGWTGSVTSTDNPLTVSMSSPMSLWATFEENTSTNEPPASGPRNVRLVDFGAKLGSGFYRGQSAPRSYTPLHDEDNNGTLSNDSVRAWIFSTNQPLNAPGLEYDTNSPSGVFYGGLTVFAVNNPDRTLSEGLLNQNHEFMDDANMMGLGNIIEGEQFSAYGVWFWQKQDFLNGGNNYTVRFDTNSTISAHISRYWGGVNAGRWLVRQGDQFYLSQATFGGKTNQYDMTTTNRVDDPGDGANNPVVRKTHTLQPHTSLWAPYNPGSAPGTNDDYEIGFNADTATFAAVEFTNVTAVGFYVERKLSTPYVVASGLLTNQPMGVKWNAFHCNAIVERPDTPSYYVPTTPVLGGNTYLASNAVPYSLWRQTYRHMVRRQYPRDLGPLTYSLERNGAMGTMRVDDLAHAGTEPVREITWLDALAFCNGLSEIEGLEPCYYSDAAMTNVLRIIVDRDNIASWTNRPTVYWKTSASGFRLPTIAEWDNMPASARDTNAWEHVWHLSGTTADPASQTTRTARSWGLTAPTNAAGRFNERPWQGSPRIGFRVALNGASLPNPAAAGGGAATWIYHTGTVLAPATTSSVEALRAEVAQLCAFTNLLVGLAQTSHAADTNFNPGATITNAPYALDVERTEVPFNLWNLVQGWGRDNGYQFNYDGDMGSMGNAPGAMSHTNTEPVTQISMYDAFAWCNAMSELMGRQPVYYFDAGFTQPYRQANQFRLETLKRDGSPNWPGGPLTPYDTAALIPVYMNVTSTGYRLLLPQEWSLANITNAQTADAAYNWLIGNSNGKSQPVGTLLPNPLGLYDMNGNVLELTWGSTKATLVGGNIPLRQGSHFARGYRNNNSKSPDLGEFAGVGRAHVGFRIASVSPSTNVVTTFTLTASVNNPARGSVSPTGGSYASGTVVQITATASNGYQFSEWTGDAAGSDNPLSLTLDADKSVTANFIIAPTGPATNILRVDFALDDSPLEADGNWQPFTVPSSTSVKTTNRVYTFGAHNVTVTLGNGTGFVGRDRANPSADSGAMTWSAMFRDLIQASSGSVTVTVAGLTASYPYAIRLWQYDYSFAGGAAFTNRNLTGGQNYILGASTNVTGNGGLPTNNYMYSVSGSVTSDANGVLMLLVETAGGTTHARLNGLEITEVIEGTACSATNAPELPTVADKTVQTGDSLYFTVVASNEACAAPALLTATGLPASATFSVTATNGLSLTGTFAWPAAGAPGTYPVRFLSANATGPTSSFNMLIYVADVGEQTNSQGVPLSQTNWHVAINSISPPSGGQATLTWAATPGVTYDIYATSDNLGLGEATWSLIAADVEATSTTYQYYVSSTGTQRYYQVVPALMTPTERGVWAVIRPTILPGFSTMGAPVDGTDLNFGGALGSNLAAVLTGHNVQGMGDEVFILNQNGSYSNLYLDGSGAWRAAIAGTPRATHQLQHGQGFVVLHRGLTAVQPEFRGPVGNQLVHTNAMTPGYNIIALSEGKYLSMTQAFSVFAEGSPSGSMNQAQADCISVLENDGNFTTLQRLPSGGWLNLSTFETNTHLFTPGRAFWYRRVTNGTPLKVQF